jgi:hypothetical protein
VHFTNFRTTPDSSGRDCNVTGSTIYGFKYYHATAIPIADYRFNNNVGEFRCALGILKNAEQIRLFSLEDSLKFKDTIDHEL